MIHERPAELLQHLIRFDTTNPPGSEEACLGWAGGLLKEYGLEASLLAKTPDRPNLIARLPGRGQAPPLLMYGHVDVVTTKGQDWTRPPFGGDIVDGWVWGRGALDMKSGVAMMLAAFLRAKSEGLTPPGDVILCLVSDEEAGGASGAGFLVDSHPEQFEGVKYAIGEFGGFTMHVGQNRFYPIMIAEKQMCWMKAVVRGPGGHGSLPLRGGAMAQAGRMLTRLDKKRLPLHIGPVPRDMIQVMAEASGFPAKQILKAVLNPWLSNLMMRLLGEAGRTFDPMIHNTVNATIIRGGEKVNVIPSEVVIELDGRLLPGFTPDDMKRELGKLLGKKVSLEITLHEPGPGEPDMGLYDTLADILRQADPGGIPTPLLVTGVTDGRHFARLGIQTYGFLPMKLPPDLKFAQLIHAADERIPVEAVEFGTEAVYALLQRFGD